MIPTFLRKNIIFPPVILAALVVFPLLFLPFAARAEMELISDENLDKVTGQGVISFTRDGNTLKASFDIGIETYTQIDSFKLGYYKGKGGTIGWDQDWTDVSFGSPEESLKMHGLYIQTVFKNINNPLSRSLESVTIGITNMSGTISATFNSFSGDIAAGNPVSGYRITPAFTEISCAGSGFSMTLSRTDGFQIHWDEAYTAP